MNFESNTKELKNGTYVTNSSYHGPAYKQTMFNVNVDYNYTLSTVESVARYGGSSVSAKLFSQVVRFR